MIAELILAASLCATSNDSFLKTLGEVESGNRDKAVGPSGEVSRFQILPRVWRQFSKLPLSEARSHQKASVVAIRIRQWNTEQFTNATKRLPDDASDYIMWNRGFTGYRRAGFDLKRVRASTRKRADNFKNLAEHYERKSRH